MPKAQVARKGLWPRNYPKLRRTCDGLAQASTQQDCTKGHAPWKLLYKQSVSCLGVMRHLSHSSSIMRYILRASSTLLAIEVRSSAKARWVTHQALSPQCSGDLLRRPEARVGAPTPNSSRCWSTGAMAPPSKIFQRAGTSGAQCATFPNRLVLPGNAALFVGVLPPGTHGLRPPVSMRSHQGDRLWLTATSFAPIDVAHSSCSNRGGQHCWCSRDEASCGVAQSEAAIPRSKKANCNSGGRVDMGCMLWA